MASTASNKRSLPTSPCNFSHSVPTNPPRTRPSLDMSNSGQVVTNGPKAMGERPSGKTWFRDPSPVALRAVVELSAGSGAASPQQR